EPRVDSRRAGRARFRATADVMGQHCRNRHGARALRPGQRSGPAQGARRAWHRAARFRCAGRRCRREGPRPVSAELRRLLCLCACAPEAGGPDHARRRLPRHRPAEHRSSGTMTPLPMSTTTVRLPEELEARIARLAEKAGTTAHALLVEAISEKAEQLEGRSDLHEEAERRFEEIIATGKA